MALLPLLAATAGASIGAAAWRGWLAGTTGFLLSMHWIALTIDRYTWLPFSAALVPYAALSAAMGVFAGASAALWTAAMRRGVPAIAAVPVSWVAMEWLRGVFPLGFPWLLLGYTQHRRIPLLQIADFGGVYVVSAVVALVNASAFDAARSRSPRNALSAAVAIAAVGSSLVYGHWRLALIGQRAPAHHLRVALVQGNVEQDHKWDPDHQQETIASYERLSLRAASEGPDVIVWPETAAPFFFQLDSPESRRVAAIARKTGVPMILGSPAFDYDAGGEGYLLNRAYALDEGGAVVGAYDKEVLVPFGEYVPLGRMLPWADAIVEGAAPFRPGSDQEPISVGAHRYGVLICYEAIFPSLARAAVRRGATVLANLTNDGWFGRTVAPDQHLAMAAMRAVESRRPLVRAANTGYSAVIGIDGAVNARTDLFRRDVRVVTLSWPALSAPYTAWGDAFAHACVAAACFMALACVGRPRHGIVSPEERRNGAA